MRPAFAADASFFGYAGGQLAVGTEFLFDWIDKNGPAPAGNILRSSFVLAALEKAGEIKSEFAEMGEIAELLHMRESFPRCQRKVG